MIKTTILLCLFSTTIFSQNISGTIYDAEAPITGAKIMNVTSKSITSTDGNGNFELYAKLNDTLIFSSLFHHTKTIVVNQTHFSATQVFELKKIINELDEVALQGPDNPKGMDENEASETLNKQFKSDVDKNPHLYRRPNANSGPIDFVEIGRRVVKLFKSKTPKEQEIVETNITSDDLDILFKTDKVFNDQFLLLNLNITKDYKHLFFAFCETKELPSSLLKTDKKFYLIDKFLAHSETFREILKESQKQ